MQNALVFQSTTFDIINRAAQPWLRGAQVALSLGYKNPDNAIKDLYTRNAAEFTDSMTALVKLPTAGGEQETRIFSLRGAHLLGMFARTEKAAAFRRWVLDILERETQPAQITLPECITASQAGELATLISERFPEGKSRPYAWGRFNNHFRLSGYKTLPASRFEEACAYIPTMQAKQPAALPLIISPSQMKRYLISWDSNLNQQVQEVPLEACVMTQEQMLKAINEPNGMFVSTAMLSEFVAAASKRLGERCAYYEAKNKSVKPQITSQGVLA